MLRRSFLFLPGIGARRERALWQNGIADWDAYLEGLGQDLSRDRRVRVSAEQRHIHQHLLQRARDALERRDLIALAGLMPPAEHWRFWGPHTPRVGCLDIETTGSHRGQPVTVVGVHDPGTQETHQLIRGRDLNHTSLHELLSRFDLLVTFNGNGFDLPVLRAHYPGAVPALPHLDVRGPLARLGYKGGLKRIERELGLARPDEVVGIDGYEAVILWRRWERGDPNALDTLLAYNAEDVLSLAPLARFAVACHRNLHAPHWGDAPSTVPWPAGERPEIVPPSLEAALDEAPAATSAQ